ncbi:MAG: glycosyltransferase [Bacteroidales bacterium]|nr:glycosyltransferase [Bacteroidales bacterium]
MPRVSVIVPNYNHARFLDERIGSVLAQTYRDFELILLDDLSTDESRAVLEKYRDRPEVSQIVFNEKNSGSSFKQWEKGIQLAGGELIWIAESDDAASPELLETLVSAFDAKPSSTLAFCAAMLTASDGKPTGIHPFHKALGHDLSLGGQEFVRRLMLERNTVVNASGALFRKDAYLNLPAYIKDSFKQFKGVGDWLFWIGIAMQGDVVYKDKALNFFRQHGSNTTSTLRLSGTGIIEEAEMFWLLKKHGVVSGMQMLNIRAANAAIVKYKENFAPETKAKCLKAWRADNPLIAAWAWYKHLVHPAYSLQSEPSSSK